MLDLLAIRIQGQMVLKRRTKTIIKAKIINGGKNRDKKLYVSPLQTQDVILGAPWFHRVYVRL